MKKQTQLRVEGDALKDSINLLSVAKQQMEAEVTTPFYFSGSCFVLALAGIWRLVEQIKTIENDDLIALWDRVLFEVEVSSRLLICTWESRKNESLLNLSRRTVHWKCPEKARNERCTGPSRLHDTRCTDTRQNSVGVWVLSGGVGPFRERGCRTFHLCSKEPLKHDTFPDAEVTTPQSDIKSSIPIPLIFSASRQIRASARTKPGPGKVNRILPLGR